MAYRSNRCSPNPTPSAKCCYVLWEQGQPCGTRHRRLSTMVLNESWFDNDARRQYGGPVLT